MDIFKEILLARSKYFAFTDIAIHIPNISHITIKKLLSIREVEKELFWRCTHDNHSHRAMSGYAFFGYAEDRFGRFIFGCAKKKIFAKRDLFYKQLSQIDRVSCSYRNKTKTDHVRHKQKS